MKLKTSWHSERLGREVNVARWGEIGVPVLIFPTAGGDAEEIERFLVIQALEKQLAEGKIKIYSCDSIAGRAMLAEEGTPAHRMHMLDQFQEYIRHELVPAIRQDCQEPEIEVVVAGSSIGAFNALASICRYPDAFRTALCMSGTYDLLRFLDAPPTPDFVRASPLHYLAGAEAAHLERLKSRFVLLASGEGRAEDIGESWRVARALGACGVPNRVDSWGEEWHHDWPTWRNMLARYVEPLIAPDNSSASPFSAGT